MNKGMFDIFYLLKLAELYERFDILYLLKLAGLNEEINKLNISEEVKTFILSQEDGKIKGQLFDAVIIRQKKPYRRNTGERVAFQDNAVALLKDEKGNPKGTQIKGPIAKEVAERWPFLAKIAKYNL